jgi:hypothetical protein
MTRAQFILAMAIYTLIAVSVAIVWWVRPERPARALLPCNREAPEGYECPRDYFCHAGFCIPE